MYIIPETRKQVTLQDIIRTLCVRDYAGLINIAQTAANLVQMESVMEEIYINVIQGKARPVNAHQLVAELLVDRFAINMSMFADYLSYRPITDSYPFVFKDNLDIELQMLAQFEMICRHFSDKDNYLFASLAGLGINDQSYQEVFKNLHTFMEIKNSSIPAQLWSHAMGGVDDE